MESDDDFIWTKENSPLTNELILSLVFNYFCKDKKFLCKLRTISSVWNRVARNFILRINSGQNLYLSSMEKMAEYIQMCGNQIPLNNSIHLAIPNFELNNRNEQFETFSQLFGLNTKSLNLPNYRRIEPKDLRNLLINAFPNLENLAICETIYINEKYEPIFLEGDSLSKLKSLQLYLDELEYNVNIPKMFVPRLSTEILQICKGLKELKLGFNEKVNKVVAVKQHFVYAIFELIKKFNLQLESIEFSCPDKIQHDRYNSRALEFMNLKVKKMTINLSKQHLFFLEFLNLKTNLPNTLTELSLGFINHNRVSFTTLPLNLSQYGFTNLKILKISYLGPGKFSFKYLNIGQIVKTNLPTLEEFHLKNFGICWGFNVSGFKNLKKIYFENIKIEFSPFCSEHYIRHSQMVNEFQVLSHLQLHVKDQDDWADVCYGIKAKLFFIWAQEKYPRITFDFKSKIVDERFSYNLFENQNPILSDINGDFTMSNIKQLDLTRFPILLKLNFSNFCHLSIWCTKLDKLTIQFSTVDVEIDLQKKLQDSTKQIFSSFSTLRQLTILFDLPIENFEYFLIGTSMEEIDIVGIKTYLPNRDQLSIRNIRNLQTIHFKWNICDWTMKKYPDLFENEVQLKSFTLTDNILEIVKRLKMKLKEIHLELSMPNDIHKIGIEKGFKFNKIFSNISSKMASLRYKTTIEENGSSFSKIHLL